MKVVMIALVLILAAIAGGLAFMYSGLADVAATSQHWALTRWVLSTTMENAVRRDSEAIKPPAFLDQEARIRGGADHYHDMCVFCHGAPGVKPGAVAGALNPRPPELTKTAGEWKPAELFWITKHGVKMTGMPGFGPTHTDEELWQIVAFVKKLPDMSAAEYRGMTSLEGE
jgi:mono/diheme cytochrome c family protein